MKIKSKVYGESRCLVRVIPVDSENVPDSKKRRKCNCSRCGRECWVGELPFGVSEDSINEFLCDSCIQDSGISLGDLA